MRHFIREIDYELDEDGGYYYEESDGLGLRLVPLELLTSAPTDTDSTDDDLSPSEWHEPHGEPPSSDFISIQQEEYLEYLRVWSVESHFETHTEMSFGALVITEAEFDRAIFQFFIALVCVFVTLLLL
jgi:hypothetical protein